MNFNYNYEFHTDFTSRDQRASHIIQTLRKTCGSDNARIKEVFETRAEHYQNMLASELSYCAKYAREFKLRGKSHEAMRNIVRFAENAVETDTVEMDELTQLLAEAEKWCMHSGNYLLHELILITAAARRVNNARDALEMLDRQTAGANVTFTYETPLYRGFQRNGNDKDEGLNTMIDKALQKHSLAKIIRIKDNIAKYRKSEFIYRLRKHAELVTDECGKANKAVAAFTGTIGTDTVIEMGSLTHLLADAAHELKDAPEDNILRRVLSAVNTEAYKVICETRTLELLRERADA